MLALGGGSSWFRGSLELQQSVDRIVLEQGPSTLLKIAMYTSPLLIVLGVYFCYAAFFVAKTTTFTCDRASGKCELDGKSEAVPSLSKIVGVELENQHRDRQGDFKFIKLVLGDGGKQYLSNDGAQRAEVVAEYRAAVDAIQAFLADPSRPKLETSWTYRASTWEKVYNVGMLVGALFFMAVVLGLANTRIYTFERGKVTLRDHRPVFGTSRRELAANEIARVTDGPAIELVLTDGSKVPILTGEDERAGAIVEQARKLLGK